MAEIDNRDWTLDELDRPSATGLDDALFVAVPFETETTYVEPATSGLKGKIDGLKRESFEHLHDYQTAIKARTDELRQTAEEMKSDLAHRVRVTKADLSQRARILKADMTERARVMQSDLSQRASTMQAQLKRRTAELKLQVEEKSADLQHDMREQPGKWAGIATGAGLTVGLIGRMLRHRAKMRRHQRIHSRQQIVIVKASC